MYVQVQISKMLAEPSMRSNNGNQKSTGIGDPSNVYAHAGTHFQDASVADRGPFAWLTRTTECCVVRVDAETMQPPRALWIHVTPVTDRYSFSHTAIFTNSLSTRHTSPPHLPSVPRRLFLLSRPEVVIGFLSTAETIIVRHDQNYRNC